MNAVNIVARLTADPVLRETRGGKQVAELRVAIRGVKRADGTEQVDFVDVTAWNGLAEITARHLAKGRLVGVSGRIAQDEWTTESGERRQRVYVVAESIDFLDAPKVDADKLAAKAA